MSYYHHLIKSAVVPAYGALTTAWIAATSETDTTIISALNTLETDGTANGWLSKMRIMYPIVGGTATKHKYNFINTATYQLTYASGMTHSSSGMAGNGSTGYADTGFANSITAQNSISAGVYIKGVLGNGLFGSIGGSSRTYLYGVGNQIYITANNDTNAIVSSALGFWGVTRTSSTTRTAVSKTTTFTDTNRVSATPSTYNQYINAINVSGSASGHSTINANIAFAFHGDGLTIAQLESMRTDVQTFQTSLGRQV